MSRTEEFVVAINGQLCVSKKGDFKSGEAFAQAILYGLNNLIDIELRDSYQHHPESESTNQEGCFSISFETSTCHWNSVRTESFEEFRNCIRPEIYQVIMEAVIDWWNAPPEEELVDDDGIFDPLAIPDNPFVAFVAHDIQLVKWPTYAVEFDNYRKEFFRDQRLEDIDFFVLWMTMEIPGLARIAQKMAIDNFNAGKKELSCSHTRLPFKAEPNQTAEEFGESVRLQVREILFADINGQLKQELEDEEQFDQFIDAEIDPNMLADVPNDDEARYAERLACPPSWFMAELAPNS